MQPEMIFLQPYLREHGTNARSTKMKHYSLFLFSSLVLLWFLAPLCATAEVNPRDASSSSPKPATVNDVYPGLTTGALTYATASDLPRGILLRSPKLVIRSKELSEEIANASQQMQPELKKNAFFQLEQIATFKLLLIEATTAAKKADKDVSEETEQQIIQDYLTTVAETADVNDAEIRDFYNSNTQMLGGASLAQIGPQIKQYLLGQKQQDLVNKHIRTIGRRMRIEISGSWLKSKAAAARDNPVDKARTSGKVSLVDFGSVGCIPCDMMAPILDKLKEKYKGKVNVLFVNVKEKPILVGRYGIQTIPVQVFFDKTGKEVFRHVGFFAEEEIEKQLLKMGVK